MTTRARLSKAVEKEGEHTNLMRAALNGDLEVMKVLLTDGADVNERNAEGRTALMFAAANSQTEAAKALLDHDADVNLVANDGGTALILAASAGDIELIRLLLSKGADPSRRYVQDERTALSLAREKNYEEIAQLLEAAGAEQS
jgi:ankyrin repeat protein